MLETENRSISMVIFRTSLRKVKHMFHYFVIWEKTGFEITDSTLKWENKGNYELNIFQSSNLKVHHVSKLQGMLIRDLKTVMIKLEVFSKASLSAHDV